MYNISTMRFTTNDVTGSEYVGHFRSGLRHGPGRFTFAHKSFEYDWARHASFHGVPKLVKKGATTPRSAAATANSKDDADGIGSQGSLWRARLPNRPSSKSSPSTSSDAPAATASPNAEPPPKEQLPMSPSGLAQRAFNLVADLTVGDTTASASSNKSNKNGSSNKDSIGVTTNDAMSSNARAKMRWKGGASKLKVLGALGKAPAALQPGTIMKQNRMYH